MTDKAVHLFVYGTLRAGERNHWMLVEQGAELVSECQTPPLFTLLHLGNYPGLIRGGNTAVRGGGVPTEQFRTGQVGPVRGAPHRVPPGASHH